MTECIKVGEISLLNLAISIRRAHIAAAPLVTLLCHCMPGHYSGFGKLCHSKLYRIMMTFKTTTMLANLATKVGN